jgi:osmotically-inducible protein OsmY
MMDKDLQRAVSDELNWDPSIDAAQIGVAVRDGIVTLTGTVGSYAEKYAAEQAASRVAGVKAIAEELAVRQSIDSGDDDTSIAKRAAQVLTWDVVVPKTVKVRVEKGQVTLSGQVHWNFQRDAALADVRRLHGVLGVINEITLQPMVQAPVLKDKIKAALTRNAQLEADEIKVTVEGGTVTLAGDVDTWYERDLAEDTAWSAPGVTKVNNQMRVI